MRALSAATIEGDPLPGHTYAFVFPIIRAVLSSPQHTSLHDEAMAVVALHCAPGGPLPRRESLQLLYHVLGVNASYRCDPQTPLQAVKLCIYVMQEMQPSLKAASHAIRPSNEHIDAVKRAQVPGGKFGEV